jgi:hypothetical protein
VTFNLNRLAQLTGEDELRRDVGAVELSSLSDHALSLLSKGAASGEAMYTGDLRGAADSDAESGRSLLHQQKSAADAHNEVLRSQAGEDEVSGSGVAESSLSRWHSRRGTRLDPLTQGRSGALSLGKKGISGWLEHGAYDDASSPRITKKQYLCLRRTTPDSESSAVSSATLFVFDSADDYHGYFAGGQSDSSLVRHRVDARAIFGVHELVDPAAGIRAIELEVRRPRWCG